MNSVDESVVPETIELVINCSSNETEISNVSEVLSGEIGNIQSENADKGDGLDVAADISEITTVEISTNSDDKVDELLDQNSSANLVETPAEITTENPVGIASKIDEKAFPEVLPIIVNSSNVTEITLVSDVLEITEISTEIATNSDDNLDQLDQNSSAIQLEETPAEIKTESLKRTLDDLSDENSDCEAIAFKKDEKPGSSGYFVDKTKAAWFRSIVSYDSSDTGSDSESSSSSSECSEKSKQLDSTVLSDVDYESEDCFVQSSKKFEIPRTEGELTLDDLPPIEDLKISVTEHEMVQMGVVHAIVDNLVVVQSYLNFPALDLDSVLFFSDGKPLGKVFDVLGPVIQPLYSVRFNNADHIKSKGVEKKMPIFCAPNVVDATSFVFIAQLASLKGSDASWQHNNEPPPQFVEYSDDEDERKAKKAAKYYHSDQSSDKLPCKRPLIERECSPAAERRVENPNAPVHGSGTTDGGTQELPVVRQHGNFQFNRPSFQPNLSQTEAQFRPRESPNYTRNIHNSSQYMSSQSYPRFPPHRFGAPLFPFRHGRPPPNPRGDFNPMHSVNQDFQNQRHNLNFPPTRF